MSTPNPPIPRPWTTRIRDIVKNIGLYRPRTPHSRLFDEIAPGALRPDNPNTVVVIVVGMDCAGKKTLLHNFLAQSPDGSDISTHTPFVGFDMAILSYGNVRFHAFDTACCRPKSFFEMERKQYQIADAVIQMIDLADRERWVESKEELAHGALHEGWGARKGTPMLVMCNGTDKEGVKDASQDEVAKLFRLDGELEERHPWHIVSTSLKTGEGVYEGLQWLSSKLKKGSSIQPTVPTTTTTSEKQLDQKHTG